MQKRYVVVLIGIIIALSIPSLQAEKLILSAGESVILNGKNVTFVGIQEESAAMGVDGDYDHVAKGELKKINGVYINVTGLSTSPQIAILIVTVNFVCGDGSCEGSKEEDYASCCIDCGCLGEKMCINNRCVANISSSVPGSLGCYVDSDCPLSVNPCTKTLCNKAITPHKCVSEKLKECIPNDNCCPQECTINNDNDCLYVDQCIKDSACNDNNPCTDDRCAGKPKVCQYTQHDGCIDNERCAPVGELQGLKYCDTSGTFIFLKENSMSCTYEYECLTQQCTRGTCGEGILGKVSTITLIMIFVISSGLILFYSVAWIKKQREQE